MHEKKQIPARKLDPNMVTIEDEDGQEIQIPAPVAQAEALFRIADALEGIFSFLSSGVVSFTVQIPAQPQEPQKCPE